VNLKLYPESAEKIATRTEKVFLLHLRTSVPALKAQSACDEGTGASPDYESEDECGKVVGSAEGDQAVAWPAEVRALAFAVRSSGVRVQD
jgi:hypothetical protein